MASHKAELPQTNFPWLGNKYIRSIGESIEDRAVLHVCQVVPLSQPTGLGS